MRKECQSISLPDGGRAIVYEWTSGSLPERNLSCVEASGEVRWVAELPNLSGSDCFVSVRRDGNDLVANTFSGYAVRIDSATGERLSIKFTK